MSCRGFFSFFSQRLQFIKTSRAVTPVCTIACTTPRNSEQKQGNSS